VLYKGTITKGKYKQFVL